MQIALVEGEGWRGWRRVWDGAVANLPGSTLQQPLAKVNEARRAKA